VPETEGRWRMTFLPLLFRWEGDCMRPIGRYAKEADANFVIGSNYRLGPVDERSDASNDHQFAWINEAWRQLPEDIADQYPSPTHLRKRALIEAGFYNEMAIDAGSNAAAIRVAAGFRSHDEFVIAVIRGPIVLVRAAKSQKRRLMKAADFQKSKTAIMEIIAGMIGVSPDDLEKNAGQAA
jgi:hypothetical protein